MIPAAAGIGSPTIYLPGFTGSPLSAVLSTLKRANRIVPHATYPKEINTPAAPSSCRDQR